MALDVSIFLQLQSNNKINSSQENNNLNSQNGNNNSFESLFSKINNNNNKIPDENINNVRENNNNLNLIRSNSNNNLISGSVLDAIIPDENNINDASDLTQENNEQNINFNFKNNLLGSIKKFLSDSGKSQDEINNIEDQINNLIDEFIKDPEHDAEILKSNFAEVLNKNNLSEQDELNLNLPDEIKNIIDEFNFNFDFAGHEVKSGDENKNKLEAKNNNDDENLNDDPDENLNNLNANNNLISGLVQQENSKINAENNDEKNLKISHEKSAKNSVVELDDESENVPVNVPVKNEDSNDDPEAFRKILTRENNNSNNNNVNNENENDDENNNFGNDFLRLNENNNNNKNSRSQNNNNDSRKNNNLKNNNVSSYDYNKNYRAENSRNDFQTFFEGVLNNRRTVSQEISAPLNLRSNFNFNQAETLREGFVNVVRFIRADGLQKANMIIDPPALGRISVELTSTTSGVEAALKVSSEQVRILVQSQITQIRMNLSQQGVQVTEFSVDVQQDNSQNNNNNSGQQNDRGQYFNFNQDDDESEEFRIDLEEGLLYWLA